MLGQEIVKVNISKIIMGTITGKIRYIKDKNDEIILPVTHEKSVKDSNGVNLETKLGNKQDALVSGTNIKTINNESLLGSGNITVQTTITTDSTPTSGSANPVQSGGVYTALGDKYEKPSGGIPSTDLSSAVQISLGKADSAIQDISGKEDKTNKVTSLSSSSNNNQYPSALCVYNLISGLTTPFSYEVVSSLPSASASTVGKIYVVTDGTDTEFYITAESSGNYSWEQLGDLDTSISTITDGEIDSLFE